MISTLATKFGAFALMPFLFFGGHSGASVDASAHAKANAPVAPFAQAQIDTEDGECLVLEHTLRFGSRDRNTDGEVSELQAFLEDEGYMKGRATGFFGVSTWRAVRSFQDDKDLRMTGVVNEETRAAIKAESCDDDSDPLAIIGIDAPTSLMTGEEGTWTVDVESESEGNLRYSVMWGDEDKGLRALFSADEEVQSSATFTHTYDKAGTYTPEFTVTDEDGNSVSRTAASVTVSEDAEVRIESLSETSGQAGDEITISGSGFTEDSDVYVGRTKAADVTVHSESSLTFAVPEKRIGTYAVYVVNEHGTSNSLRFKIEAEVAGRVSVSGIDAPVRLEVNEEGTWTVHATTNTQGNLRYSVEWGDEGMFEAMATAMRSDTQTSSTFTHTYTDAGTYNPKFTVMDEDGNSASVRASVVVSE